MTARKMPGAFRKTQRVTLLARLRELDPDIGARRQVGLAEPAPR